MPHQKKIADLKRFIQARQKYLHDLNIYDPPGDFSAKYCQLEGRDKRRFRSYKQYHRFLVELMRKTRRQVRQLYELETTARKTSQTPVAPRIPTRRPVPKKPVISTARKIETPGSPVKLTKRIRIRPVTPSLLAPRPTFAQQHPTTPTSTSAAQVLLPAVKPKTQPGSTIGQQKSILDELYSPKAIQPLKPAPTYKPSDTLQRIPSGPEDRPPSLAPFDLNQAIYALALTPGIEKPPSTSRKGNNTDSPLSLSPITTPVGTPRTPRNLAPTGYVSRGHLVARNLLMELDN